MVCSCRFVKRLLSEFLPAGGSYGWRLKSGGLAFSWTVADPFKIRAGRTLAGLMEDGMGGGRRERGPQSGLFWFLRRRSVWLKGGGASGLNPMKIR